MGNGVTEQIKREVNDRIHAILADFGMEDGDFVCECGDEACPSRITITIREYAARDGTPLLGEEHQRTARA